MAPFGRNPPQGLGVVTLPFGGSNRREGSHCTQYFVYLSDLRPPTRPPAPIPKERRMDNHDHRTEAPRESPLPTDPTPRQGVRASRSQGSPGEPCRPGAPLRTSLVHLRASPAQDWGLKSPRCPFSPLLAGHHFGPNFKQNKTKQNKTKGLVRFPRKLLMQATGEAQGRL